MAIPGYRTDIGTLRPAKRMSDGRLRVDAHITRPGVFEYADATKPGGIRRELRESKEVLSQAHLDSLAQVPVTNNHPPDLVTSETARRYMVGATGDTVTRDDDHVRATLMIADRATADQMEAGKVAVSEGYYCDYDDTPGEHPVYGRYDGIQRNIRANHVAIVEAGRAGRTARVRMDAELSAAERDDLPANKFAVPGKGKLPIHDAAHTKAAMSRLSSTEDLTAEEKATAAKKISAAAKKFGIDASGFDEEHGLKSTGDSRKDGDPMADEDKVEKPKDTTIRALGAALKTAEERAAAAEAKLAARSDTAGELEGQLKIAQKRIDELTSELAAAKTAGTTAANEALQARLDAAEGKIARFDEAFAGAVRARVALARKAMVVMGDDFRMDDLDDRQVMAAVVKRLDSSADLGANVETGVIRGMFNALTDQHLKTARSIAHASTVLAETHAQKPRVDAREENTNRARNAWKEPLPNDPRAHRAAGGGGQ